jgi:hypothetical protein
MSVLVGGYRSFYLQILGIQVLPRSGGSQPKVELTDTILFWGTRIPRG